MSTEAGAGQCAVPAVPDGGQPGPLDWPAGAHARRIGDTLERLNPRWAEVMDGKRSPWEQWVREQVCPRQTPAEAGERDHAGIWPQPVPRGRHAAPVTEPVPPMTRPYRIPEAAVICDEATAPRPGQEAEGISLPSITGPGRAESLDEYLASPGYQAALAAADAESWDQPGVSVEDMIAAADERRRAARADRLNHAQDVRDGEGETAGRATCAPPPADSRAVPRTPRPGQDVERESRRSSITGPGRSDEDGDAEQFGPPDEPFWGKDKPRIEPPPETAGMTAITEQPGQEQS